MSEIIIDISEPHDGVCLLRMQDRAGKNGFSDRFVADLQQAFADVGRRETCRAVVLTGYGSYFSSGGTQDGLRDLYEGRMRFTDRDLYSVALQCPVPVVAAMQGHAIGGGFVMGLFADLVVLAREAVYTANFMQYGFTPGMGATCVLPLKLGTVLAHEAMLTAGTYRGEELQRRGALVPVLPRDQVLPHALELARSLAEKPRLSLITLKDHLADPLRQQLPSVIAQEVAMHERTFHQPDVRRRIEALFGQ